MKHIAPLLLVGIIAIAGGQAAKTEPTSPDKSDSSQSDSCNQCQSDAAIESLKSEIEQLKARIHEYETSAGEIEEVQDVVDEPDAAMQLYEQAMSYRANGGTRWTYSGSDLVSHLVRSHGYDRDDLVRQSREGLIWIHSMSHDQEVRAKASPQYRQSQQYCPTGNCPSPRRVRTQGGLFNIFR